ncbi:MAG: immunoglobulin domain-containing protein, partial [Verrucomicrobiales bacterium]|nr:immunoglobulin domain-containing protein [Verrucomicrobiales bacterium]
MLTAVVPVGEPRAFQWFHKGQPIPGATGATLEVREMKAENAGLYQLRVEFPDGTQLNALTRIGYLPRSEARPPTLIKQPSPWLGYPWSTVTFSALATGQKPIRYQWFRNGVAIENATNAVFEIPAVQLSDAGQYHLEVVNDFGSVRSEPGSLSFHPPTVPRITKQPLPLTLALGASGVLSAVGSDPAPARYEWLLEGRPLRTTDIWGLRFDEAGPSDYGDYQVIIRNGYPGGAVTSQVARLTVVPPVPPTVLAWPVDRGVSLGEELRLSPSLVGTPPLRYSWWRNGTFLKQTTEATLRINPARSRDAGEYVVYVSNDLGTVGSPKIRVVVTNPPPPRILAHPQATEVMSGQRAELRVQAEGSGTLSYRWIRNGADIAATGDRFVLISAQPPDSGEYRVRVSNASGSVTSEPAALLVLNDAAATGGKVRFVNRISGTLLDAPVFHADGITPVSGAGYVAQLYAGPTPDTLRATGTPAPFRSGIGAGYWDPGMQADRAVRSVQPGDLAWVEVRVWELASGNDFEAAEAAGGIRGKSTLFSVVTGGAGVPPSVSAPLQGLASFRLGPSTAPRILTQPVGGEWNLGAGFAVSVVAEGEGLTYQWELNAVPIPGAEGPSLTRPAISQADQGFYQVVVRGVGGRVVSDFVPVVVSVRREFNLGAGLSVIGGGRVWIPLHFETRGEVGAGRIRLRYDPSLLGDPVVTFRDVFGNGSKQWSAPEPGAVDLEFAASSEALPRGKFVLAMIGFQSAAVGAIVPTQIEVEIPSLADRNGSALATGSKTTGTAITLVPRAFFGDNNGNLRLDIGDFSRELVLTSKGGPIEPPPPQVDPSPWRPRGETALELVTDPNTVVLVEATETLGEWSPAGS